MARNSDVKVRITADAGDLNRELAKSERAMGRFADESEKSSSKASDAFAKIGPALVGVAVGAGALFAKGFTDSMDRELASDKLAAQLGLSPDRQAELGKVAGKLYADAYGESLGEVNTALASILQHGVAPDDISDTELRTLTTYALDLAKAFDQDVGPAAAAVGQMIRNGLVPDATHGFDVLTRGFQQGADKAGDLLETMNEYGTLFRDVGISADTAMGLMVQGLGAGARDADKVADAIKEFAIRAKDGSVSTADGFKALGLDGARMAAKVAAGGRLAADALDETLDALRRMEDPVARDAAAVKIFGAMAEDLGDALLALDPTTAVAALGEVGGAAERMGDTLNDNASTKVEAFKRKIETALVGFIEAEVIPAFESMGAVLVDWWDTDGKRWFADFKDGWNDLMLGAQELSRWWTDEFMPAFEAGKVDFKVGIGEMREWMAQFQKDGGASSDDFKAGWDVAFDKFKDRWHALKTSFPIGMRILGDLAHLVFVQVLWKGILGGIAGGMAIFLGNLWGLIKAIGGALGWLWDKANGIADVVGGLDDVFKFITNPGGWGMDQIDNVIGLGKFLAGGFDMGGTVPGPKGSPQLVLAHGGETIMPTHKNKGGMSGTTVNNYFSGVPIEAQLDQANRRMAATLAGAGVGG